MGLNPQTNEYELPPKPTFNLPEPLPLDPMEKALKRLASKAHGEGFNEGFMAGRLPWIAIKGVRFKTNTPLMLLDKDHNIGMGIYANRLKGMPFSALFPTGRWKSIVEYERKEIVAFQPIIPFDASIEETVAILKPYQHLSIYTKLSKN